MVVVLLKVDVWCGAIQGKKVKRNTENVLERERNGDAIKLFSFNSLHRCTAAGPLLTNLSVVHQAMPQNQVKLWAEEEEVILCRIIFCESLLLFCSYFEDMMTCWWWWGFPNHVICRLPLTCCSFFLLSPPLQVSIRNITWHMAFLKLKVKKYATNKKIGGFSVWRKVQLLLKLTELLFKNHYNQILENHRLVSSA